MEKVETPKESKFCKYFADHLVNSEKGNCSFMKPAGAAKNISIFDKF